jgi:signal transduction histidine kinase
MMVPGDGTPEPVRFTARDSEVGPLQILNRLLGVVQELSLARDLGAIMQIVRVAARELTGAEGATFVLRDGDLCYYADECAIAPLWKGLRFPMSRCVSGWVMENRVGVAIEDVFADPRVPADAYRPTFVKSLAMMPIRAQAPIGAIGSYWAAKHRATPETLRVLQALADSTSVAMEKVEVYSDLERRVQQRTHELEAANRDLAAAHEALLELQQQKEAASALVVHDLKSPAFALMLAASLRLRSPDLLPADGRCWSRVLSSAEHIHRTALDLLEIAASCDGKLNPKPVAIDIGALFAEVRELLLPQAEKRGQAIALSPHVPPGGLQADPNLLRRVLQNLIDNALHYGPAQGTVRLEARARGAWVECSVGDEAPRIPPHLREHIFERYVRVADGANKNGQGLGLTFCRLAIEAHGGAIWIEDNEPRGNRFCFRLPAPLSAQSSLASS